MEAGQRGEGAKFVPRLVCEENGMRCPTAAIFFVFCGTASVTAAANKRTFFACVAAVAAWQQTRTAWEQTVAQNRDAQKVPKTLWLFF